MAGSGVDVTASLIDAKNRELDRLEAIYRSLLSNAGVELIEGRGVVSGPTAFVSASGRSRRNDFLIATGGWPQIPARAGSCGTRHYLE